MARSTKSYEERMLQLEKKEQESLEKGKTVCSTETGTEENVRKMWKPKSGHTGSARLAVRWNRCWVLRLRKKISRS